MGHDGLVSCKSPSHDGSSSNTISQYHLCLSAVFIVKGMYRLVKHIPMGIHILGGTRTCDCFETSIICWCVATGSQENQMWMGDGLI